MAFKVTFLWQGCVSSRWCCWLSIPGTKSFAFPSSCLMNTIIFILTSTVYPRILSTALQFWAQFLLECFSLLFYFEPEDKFGQYSLEPPNHLYSEFSPEPLMLCRTKPTKSGSQLHACQGGSAEFRVLSLAGISLNRWKRLGRKVITYWKVHLESIDNFLLSCCSKLNKDTTVNRIT